MWCTYCRQDVPGIVCAEGGEYRCPRCAQGIYSPHEDARADPTRPEGDEGQSSSDHGLPDVPSRPTDEWDQEFQLEDIGRAVRVDRPQVGEGKEGLFYQYHRLDAAHDSPAGRHSEAANRLASGQSPQPDAGFAFLSLLIWSALLLGLMTFVCGGVLLAWSILGGREELWSIGLPITLAGQIALLIGLVLQLDRLWHDHRNTAAKLDHFDEELNELKTTTTILGNGQVVGGGNFYAHLAGGAGPELLLADLKGQLDLLAMKVGKRH